MSPSTAAALVVAWLLAVAGVFATLAGILVVVGLRRIVGR